MRYTKSELKRREYEREAEVESFRDELMHELNFGPMPERKTRLVQLIERAYTAGERRGEEDGWRNAPDGW